MNIFNKRSIVLGFVTGFLFAGALAALAWANLMIRINNGIAERSSIRTQGLVRDFISPDGDLLTPEQKDRRLAGEYGAQVIIASQQLSSLSEHSKKELRSAIEMAQKVPALQALRLEQTKKAERSIVEQP